MSAYLPIAARELFESESDEIVAKINLAQTGVRAQQQVAWREQVILLQTCFTELEKTVPDSQDWFLLFEYQQLRIKKRVDLIILAHELIFCVEFKVGAKTYDAADRRQAEEYALDLRDFHEESHDKKIIPVLCSTKASSSLIAPTSETGVSSLSLCGGNALASTLEKLWKQAHDARSQRVDPHQWNDGRYRPIPTVVEAAETIFGAHTNMDIDSYLAHKDDLNETTRKVLEIVDRARTEKKHVVCFVTGVPGSGKTLVGLRTVHDPALRGRGSESAAYLSGNSPLVAVLREALARDKKEREQVTKANALKETRAAIQHIMDFLREYLDRDTERPPHNHVVVFDEAQRAWDEKYGKQKFGREASEPELILSIMARHTDWSVVVALIGGGQEINKGEGGLELWGAAIESRNRGSGPKWEVVASEIAFDGGAATAGGRLFPDQASESSIVKRKESSLHLPVSVRSHRSELTNEWIEHVLNGDRLGAARKMRELAGHQIYLTRSLEEMRSWLLSESRGNRRCGMVASSGARRLRAYGLGVNVGATDLDATVHWFLAPPDDVRSSMSLEVTANEYGCQGLEIDHVGLCWGGDLTWSDSGGWIYRRFSGSRWQMIKDPAAQENLVNTYRVLLSRARESLVLWVPPGDKDDHTRPPEPMDATANYLLRCGVQPLERAGSREVSRAGNLD